MPQSKIDEKKNNKQENIQGYCQLLLRLMAL